MINISITHPRIEFDQQVTIRMISFFISIIMPYLSRIEHYIIRISVQLESYRFAHLIDLFIQRHVQFHTWSLIFHAGNQPHK